MRGVLLLSIYLETLKGQIDVKTDDETLVRLAITHSQVERSLTSTLHNDIAPASAECRALLLSRSDSNLDGGKFFLRLKGVTPFYMYLKLKGCQPCN